MNWEIGIDMYTLICIKQITNKSLLIKNKIQKKKSVAYTKEKNKFVLIINEDLIKWRQGD